MSLRIVSGIRRGAKLFTLPGLATRPMGERARQAVYNVLGDRVDGARVLDLFAGSGCLGLEAISRGASRTVFVESSRDAVAIISRNIEKLRFSDHAKILQTDVFHPVLYATEAASSDIIFIDPPYVMVRSLTAESPFGSFLAELSASAIPSPGCIIVLGHHRESVVEERFGNLVLVDRRHYGTNGVAFLRMEGDKTQPDLD